MPRPRILGGPRSKSRDVAREDILIDLEESDCEISASTTNVTPPILAPIFTLQCIQNPSSSGTGNIFNGQNLVMLMPVNSDTSQLFNLMQKSQLPMYNDQRAVSAKRKNVKSSIQMSNSIQNRQPIARDYKTNDSNVKIEISSDNSSIDEPTSNVSIGSVECLENRKFESVLKDEKCKKKILSDSTEVSISLSKKSVDGNLPEKSMISNKSEDPNSSGNLSQKSRKIDNFSKNRRNLTVVVQDSKKMGYEETFSKIQCKVCNIMFTDRTKMHRHATSVHPDVQISFCDRCSDSFLTQRELNAHHGEICKRQIARKNKLSKTISVEGETSSVSAKSAKVPREKIGDISYKYVEKEVINYTNGDMKKSLCSAEIKSLVVPLARLNQREIVKYRKKSVTGNNDKKKKLRKRATELEKLSRDSLSVIGKKKINPLIGGRKLKMIKSEKRKTNYVKELNKNDEIEEICEKYSNTNDFRTIVRPIDSDSEENTDKSAIVDVTHIYKKKITTDEVNQVIGIEQSDDSENDEHPGIRKLTSRSSKASVVSSKTRKLRESVSEENEDFSSKKLRQNIHSYSNRSLTKLVVPGNFEEFCPDEFQKESIKKENAKNQQEKSLDFLSNVITRKTYLPSKRKSPNPAKSKNFNSNDLCEMCRALFTLMKQLSRQSEKNKSKSLSMKCPLCHLHFISMFYLREHIANNHLHCQSRSICKLAKSSLAPRSVDADASLNCETEVNLALECQRCAMKFSKEEDLVDHVFTNHDLPIFHPKTGDEKPDYVAHLPNDCFQTRIPESPSNIRQGDNKLLESATEEAAESKKIAAESVLRCSLCNVYFPSCIGYVWHVKNSHALLSESPLTPEPKDTELPSLAPKMKTDTDQTNPDCDSLLKQLMSDDSCDSSKDTRGKFGKQPEETSINSPKSTVSRETNGDGESTDLFSDSTSWTDVEKIDSTRLSLSESKIDATTPGPIGAEFGVTDPIFSIEDDYDDFTPVYESDESNEGEINNPRSEKSIKTATSRDCIENDKQKGFSKILELEADDAKRSEEANRKWPIECAKCDRKFPNQSSLNEHLFFLHDDSLKDTILTDVTTTPNSNQKEPHQWHCDLCSQPFKLLQSYNRHRYFVHGDDEFVHVCENCCKVLSSVTMVNVHICTDVASYNCRTCNKTFPTGMSLRLHNMEKHIETNGPHICEPCDKKFLTNAMLKRHEKSKHRFFRPYRPRKNSPVRMATELKNEKDSESEQEYMEMDHNFNRKTNTSEKRVTCTQEMMRKRLKPEFSRDNRLNRSATFINESEIFQCRLCQLYCFSKAALKAHEIQCHRNMSELCKICDGMHSKGKLLRHMIDFHIMPCDRNFGNRESMWNIGKSIEEKDAEECIDMLGIKRLISMCEYQRFNDGSTESAFNCPNCDLILENSEGYKEHFFTIHDVMCAICDIEFKSGDKAAHHKIEEHKSMNRYTWFVDNTIAALTAATNFSVVAEQSFIRMISRDSDEETDQSDDDLLNAIEEAGKIDLTTGLPENFDDMEDKKLIIVVTDEDLEKYQMGTEKANIWGLASKISSTCKELTPSDVKDMLDPYFKL